MIMPSFGLQRMHIRPWASSSCIYNIEISFLVSAINPDFDQMWIRWKS